MALVKPCSVPNKVESFNTGDDRLDAFRAKLVPYSRYASRRHCNENYALRSVQRTVFWPLGSRLLHMSDVPQFSLVLPGPPDPITGTVNCSLMDNKASFRIRTTDLSKRWDAHHFAAAVTTPDGSVSELGVKSISVCDQHGYRRRSRLRCVPSWWVPAPPG